MIAYMAQSPVRRKAGQSAEEMAAQMVEAKQNSRLYGSRQQYNELSAQLKHEALISAIDQQQQLLAKARERGKVDLNNLDELQAAVNEYLESCKQAGVIPSMMGLAPSLGYSRQNIYLYISKHATESARFLDTLRTSWAAIVQQLGLSRVASEPVAIFVLKNSGQGMVDKLDITAQTGAPDLEKGMSREELEAWFREEAGDPSDSED